MIGCIAKATSDTLDVDFDEMDAVRWVTREEAARAVSASLGRTDPYPSAAPKALCLSMGGGLGDACDT